MPRRSLLVTLLAAFGCSREPSFRDVQKGEIELDASEQVAIERLLDESDLKASELRLAVPDAVGSTPADSSATQPPAPSVTIDAGHVVRLSIDREVREPALLAPFARLRELRLGRPEFADLQRFGSHPELVTMRLGGWFGSVASLAGLEGCDSLEVLQVRGPLADLSPLGKCSNLRELHLERGALTSLETLPRSDALRSITLASGELESLAGLEAATALETLTLADLDLLTTLATLPSLEALRELTVHRGGLTTLAGLPPLPSLETLTVADAPLADPGDFGRRGAAWPRLRTLELTDGELTGAVQLDSFDALEQLDLSGNAVTALTLAPQPQLTSLSLANTRSSDLSGLGRQPRLETVDLNATPVRDLTPLLELPALRYLDILDSEVGEVPRGLLERAVAIRRDEAQVEANQWEQTLREAWEEEGFLEHLPSGGGGSVRRHRSRCRWIAGTFRDPRLSCDNSAESLAGFVWVPLVRVDPLRPASGGPNQVRVRVTLEVEEGTARVYVRDRIDFRGLAEALAGYHDSSGPMISFGDQRDPEDYRDGYRFAEARPGEPGIVSGEAALLVDQWVIWLESVDGPARGVSYKVEPR